MFYVGLNLISYKTVHLTQFFKIKYSITVHTSVFAPFNNYPTIVRLAIIISYCGFQVSLLKYYTAKYF